MSLVNINGACCAKVVVSYNNTQRVVLVSDSFRNILWNLAQQGKQIKRKLWYDVIKVMTWGKHSLSLEKIKREKVNKTEIISNGSEFLVFYGSVGIILRLNHGGLHHSCDS